MMESDVRRYGIPRVQHPEEKCVDPECEDQQTRLVSFLCCPFGMVDFFALTLPDQCVDGIPPPPATLQ